MLVLQKCVEEVNYLESFSLIIEIHTLLWTRGDKTKETNYSSSDPWISMQILVFFTPHS